MKFTRWHKPNGYRDVLAISLPLVASFGSITLMQFTDRIFLAKYSVDAIAAALPAGFTSFTILCTFLGVASYSSTFIAQYSGANAPKRVGASLWQGIYFSLITAVIMACFYFISGPIFDAFGHSPHIRELEITYFNVMTLGAGLPVLGSALASFYNGRGLTSTVMYVHISGAAINIPLDYCLINGLGPFPELGIFGAAIATVVSYIVIVSILLVLIFRKNNRKTFGTWSERRFDKELFSRLMRYGLPSGIQFFLEIAGFSFFIIMLGRIGDVELATSNIVLSIESLSFLPMVGIHIGTATLVGQAIGRGSPEEGVFAVTTALHVILLYMAIIASLFLFAPDFLLNLFRSSNYSAEEFREIRDLGVVLLRFVALFCLFDSMNLIFSAGIKGAGDTRFIMWTVGAIAFGFMIIPAYIAVEILHAGIYTLWILVTFYIAMLGLAFLLRYKQGKWKKMSVMEKDFNKMSGAAVDGSLLKEQFNTP